MNAILSLPPGLSESEKSQLKVFLQALTDKRFHSARARPETR
jgi:hypothetical protein